ncbi:MAG: protein phosphatase 2C domain-containing protein [Clostridiales bacterium]|nr:protein phosphatase 2C domain-containing protein [Clostridiales bacterium]
MRWKKAKSEPVPERQEAETVQLAEPDAYSPEPRLRVTSLSLLGTRKSQQDWLEYGTLSSGQFAAVLCDGMGGLNGGERAAVCGCTVFLEECEAAIQQGQAPDLARIARRLDARVVGLTDVDGMPLDGGCTLVAVLGRGSAFRWVSVGDSRLGLFRDGQLMWLNRLHNYRLELDEALSEGAISQAEYQAELPRGAALLSYLGCGELRYIDVQNLQLVPGDLLLLCSDGFPGMLPEQELPQLLARLNPGLNNLTELLSPYLDQTRAGLDNASAVLIRYQ